MHDRRTPWPGPRLPALAALLVCPAVLAHHPMGGDTPATAIHGLLSGIGHPLIGWDHALFLAAVGLMSAAASRIWLLPAAFVLAVPLGVTGQELIGAVPGAALLSPLTVIAVAGIMTFRTDPPAALPMALLMGLAGLAHGHAYAEAIAGAEPTPLVAYLAGLTLVQTGATVAVALLARRLLTMHAAGATRSLRPAGMALLALSGLFLAV